MNRRVLIAAAWLLIAFGAMACTDIIFPDEYGQGGNPRPDTALNGGDRIKLSGTIVSDGIESLATMPYNTKVALVWERENGEAYVYGVGEINRSNYTWTLSINEALPLPAYKVEQDGRRVFGIAHIVLLSGNNVKNGTVLQDDIESWPVGISLENMVTYATDKISLDQSVNDFLKFFPKGYSTTKMEFDIDPVIDPQYSPSYRPGPKTNLEVIYGMSALDEL
jgi:hypothetical protein